MKFNIKRIENQVKHIFQERVARDTVTYSVGRLIAGLLGFLSIPLFFQKLGPNVYGNFSLISYEVIMITQISSGWLQHATIRYKQEYAALGTTPDFDTAQRLLTRLTIIISIFSMALLSSMQKENSLLIIAALSLTTGLCSMQSIWLSNAMSDLRATHVVFAELVRVTVPMLVVYGLTIQKSLGIEQAIIAIGVGWGVSTIFLIKFANKQSKYTHIDYELIRKMVNFGMPMAVWFFLNFGQIYIIRKIMQNSNYTLEFSIYSILQDLAMKVGTVTLMPIVYAVHTNGMVLKIKGDVTSLNKIILMSYYFHCCVIITCVLLWIFFNNIIMTLVAGSNVSINIMDNIWFGASIIFATLLSQTLLISHKRLEFTGRTDVMVIIGSMSLIFATMITWWLIDLIGGFACSLGLIVANVFYIYSSEVMGRRLQVKKINKDATS